MANYHRRRKTAATTLIGLFIAATILISQALIPQVTSILKPSPSQKPGPSGVQTESDWLVSKVVDGDTLDVTKGSREEKVRLLGIDTPETHDPRKPVQCFGLAAASYTKQLLNGQTVKLTSDPLNDDRDKYRRLLRYAYTSDGTLINAKLIEDGYAFAYTVYPITKLDEFKALEKDAREHNRGLWGGCNIDESNKIKQTTTQK